MDATPTLAMGATLTMRVRNPLAAAALGLACHAVLDTIPHYHVAWIMGASRLALVDVAVGVCLALVIVAMAPVPWGSALGALGAAFPAIERIVTGRRHDFMEAPPLNFPHSEIGLPWGLLTQIAVTLIAIGLAVRLRRGRASRRALTREV